VQQGLDRMERLYSAWSKPAKAAEYRAQLNRATEAAKVKAKP
jgi:hypothetical protein